MNPNIAIAILLITFVLLIMIKCPITFSMIISTAFTMLYIQVPVMTLVQQMSKQLNSFHCWQSLSSSLWGKSWLQAVYPAACWPLQMYAWGR